MYSHRVASSGVNQGISTGVAKANQNQHLINKIPYKKNKLVYEENTSLNTNQNNLKAMFDDVIKSNKQSLKNSSSKQIVSTVNVNVGTPPLSPNKIKVSQEMNQMNILLFENLKKLVKRYKCKIEILEAEVNKLRKSICEKDNLLKEKDIKIIVLEKELYTPYTPKKINHNNIVIGNNQGGTQQGWSQQEGAQQGGAQQVNTKANPQKYTYKNGFVNLNLKKQIFPSEESLIDISAVNSKIGGRNFDQQKFFESKFNEDIDNLREIIDNCINTNTKDKLNESLKESLKDIIIKNSQKNINMNQFNHTNRTNKEYNIIYSPNDKDINSNNSSLIENESLMNDSPIKINNVNRKVSNKVNAKFIDNIDNNENNENNEVIDYNIIYTDWQESNNNINENNKENSINKSLSDSINNFDITENRDLDYLDEMTYEQINEIQDEIGFEHKGYSIDDINKIEDTEFNQTFSCSERCVICQFEYLNKDLVKRLPCKHLFHSKCALEWLSKEKKCPICMAQIKL